MKLCLDISQIAYIGTGVGRFTHGLVDTILHNDTQNQWCFFFSGLRQKPPKDICHLTRWYANPQILSHMWNDRLMPIVPGTYDWFISSDWTQPPPHISHYKATIVHDLVFRRYPETVETLVLTTQKKRLHHVSKECNIIFADSIATADDINKYYPHTQAQIIVNYPGQQPVKILSQSIKKHKPYLLAVGKLEPRKNIPRLIDAFNQANLEAYELWIVGATGWGETLTSHNPNIKFLGFVSDDQLATLYQNAHAFVFPSIYEGFGFPAIEAMQYGCPTALAHTSSLQEIGSNDASIFFDPNDTVDMTRALKTIVYDDALRSRVVTQAQSQLVRYDWDMYYHTMMRAFQYYHI